MSKTEILEELPKLTKTERQYVSLRLSELDKDDWLDRENSLTVRKSDTRGAAGRLRDGF